MNNSNLTTTANSTLEEVNDEGTKTYLIVLTFLSSVLISGGNVLTIVAIVTNEPLRTRSNAFVASLAAADLVVGVAVSSFGLWLVPEVRHLWESAIYVCVTQLAYAFMSIFVSIYSMLLVAIDRWLIISRPFLHQRIVGKKVITGAIILPWLFGIIFGSSQFYIVDPDQDECRIVLLYPKVYHTWILQSCYFFAVAGIFFFYLNIILIARHHGKAIRRQNRVQANLAAVDNQNDLKNGQSKFNDKNSGGGGGGVGGGGGGGTLKFNEQHWKAAKMMMTVFGVFFVCWTPRILLFSFESYNMSIFSDVFSNLGLLNSGVNFLVYPLHSHEFRTAFKKILLSCCRKF